MVEIIALLMFVGTEQKLNRNDLYAISKKCIEKKRRIISTRNSNATLYVFKSKGRIKRR